MQNFTGTQQGNKSNYTFMQASKMFRWIFVMSFFFIGTFVSNNVKAQYSNVPVTGYNSDVVANGVGSVSSSTTATFDNTQYTLAASDWNFNGSCAALTFFMPVSGTVNANSTVASGLVYTLQPYNANNDLRIPLSGSGTGSGTLTLVTPVSASKLFLLYGIGNGPITSGLNVTVTFTDASTQVFTGLTGLDWFATTNPAASNLGRVDRTATPACATTVTGGPQLFDLALTINASNYNKLVQSITIDKTLTGNTVNIMAVGRQAPCVVPADAATGLTQGTTTTGSIAASWTAAPSTPTGYLVVGYPTGATPVTPVTGTTYTAGQGIGTGKVIQAGAGTSTTASGLQGGTTYDVYVYSMNTGATCGGPVYNTASVLSGSMTTATCTGLAAGTYTVGTGGTYATLTAALTDVGNGITGPVILELLSNYTSAGETFPIAFPYNACINATNTLTIRPEAAATNLSITTNNTTGTINFNGATYVTIDGRPGGTGTVSQLTIANTNAGASYAVNFANDAFSNTVKYCTVTSRNNVATSGTIVFGAGLISGNDNNTIDNCSIKDDGTGNPVNGIYSAGTSSSVDNSGNTISNNNISNYFSATLVSSGILLTGTGNSGWSITGNRLFQTANRVFTTANTHNGISVQSGSGYTITGNIIGFANAAGTGTTNLVGLTTGSLGGTFPSSYTVSGTANATRYIAINCAFTAGGTNSVIQTNTIAGFALYTSSGANTSNGILCAINVTSGNATIGGATAGLGNTIGATSGLGSIYTACTTTGGTMVGIFASSANTVTIQNNTMGAIDAVGTSATLSGGFTGIDLAGAGNFVANNNTIGNTTVDNMRSGHTPNGANLTNSGGTLTSTSGGTSVMLGIRSAATGSSLSINTNIFRGWATSGTSIATTGITSSGTMTTATPSVTLNGNALGTSGLGWVRFAFANSGTITGISLTNTIATSESISNNDIQGITYAAASTGAHNYLTLTGATATGNTSSVNGNTFTNLNVNTSGAIVFLNHNYAESATSILNFNNNSIVTGFARGSAGSITLTTSNSTSAAGSILNMTGNNFSNITVTGSSTLLGFNNTDGGVGTIKTITGNTFNNWQGTTSTITGMLINYFNGASSVSSNNITNMAGTGAITAMTFGSTQNVANPLNISSNTITGLVSSGTGGAVTGITVANTSPVININNNTVSTLSTTAGSAVIGIAVTGATATNVFKNTICNLSGSATGSTVNGVLVSGGTTVTLYNNRIGDLRTAAAINANSIIGLNVTGGTTVRAYYNTVYINGTSTGATFGSSAISASTGTNLTLNNNIFYNSSTNVGTGVAVAYRRSSNVLTSYVSTSNNNLFFASTIYTDGTTPAATLSAYKTTVASRDAQSVTENLISSPTFLSTTCGDPNFLKISTSVATQLESGGTPIAGITDDFENDTRNAGTPDIGADEFTGVLSDLQSPSISAITATTSICSTTSRNITALISDPSGVDNASFQPRAYYRKNGGSYSSVAGSLTSGTVNAGTWTFTLNYALLGGTTALDVIDYFIVAQDVPGNAGGNPSGGLALTNVTNVTSNPTTPLTYTIQAILSGTYTVGAGGNYTTLTAAVAAYNASCLGGPVVFSLTAAAYTEAAALTINANADASATNTLTIKPTLANTTIAVTGGSSSAIFILNGADYIIIDGSINNTANTVCPASAATRDLTITNTNSGTSSAVVWLQTTGTDAATNNTVKNCNLVGNSNTTTLFAVGSGSSSIGTGSLGTGNNNNSYINNNISKTQYGIYSQGASIANKNTGTVINQNLMNTASPNNIGIGGIIVGFEDNIGISGNNVSGINQSGSFDIFGINAGFTTAFLFTTLTGNEVTNATIRKNVINSIVGTSTTGFSAIGIGLASAATGTSEISNNMISGVLSFATPSDMCVGIFTGGGAASTKIYYNTVVMTGQRSSGTSGGTTPSYALAINGTTPIVDVKNNILVNTTTSGNSTPGKSFAIGLGYSSTTGNYANLLSNNNDFFVSGAQGVLAKVGNIAQGSGTEITTLAGWQSETGRDAATITVSPVFVSASNLHLNVSSTNNLSLENTGTAVSVTDDIDCTVRSLTTPDIGADEFTYIPPAVINTVSASPSTTQCVATARTITANVTAGGSNITTVTLNYSYNGVAQSPVTMTGGNVNSGQTSNWTGTIPAATPANATVTWTVTVVDGGGSIVANGTSYADAPLTGASISASASPNPACAGSNVVLTATAIAAGSTRTLGAGATTPSSYEGVLYNLFGGVKSQFLVKASELTAIGLAAGNITSIGLNFGTAPGVNYQGFAINIAPTALTALTSTLVNTGFVQVYAGTGVNGGYTPTLGVNNFTFGTGAGSSSSFAWDGTSNIVVQFCYSNNNSGGTGNSFAKTDAPGFTCGAYFRSDSQTPAVLCATTAGTGTLTSRPQLIFIGNGPVTLSSYAWTDGTSTVGTTNPTTVNPSTTTSYTVTGTDVNGCTMSSPAITVTTIALPASPNPNNSIQCGTGVPACFVTTGGGGAGFKWYSAQTGGTLLQNGGGTYTTSISSTQHFWVSESNGTCESPRVEVVAFVNAPDPVQASVDNNNVCRNTQIQLTATTTGNTNGNVYSFVWTASPASGSGIPTSQAGGTGTFGTPASINITPTASGTFTYTVTATDGTLGCVTTSTVVVTVKALPQINTTTATPSTICAGTNVTLNGTSGTQASGPVQVGAGASTITGATTSLGSPYNNWYGGIKQQIIYTKAELNALGMSAGNITALAFDLTAVSATTLTMANFTINVGHTTQSASVNPLITTGLTQVYSNALQGVNVGLNTYTFTTPFNWNNVDNIVVSICWSNVNSGSTANQPTIKVDAASFNATAYIYADNTSAAALFSASNNSSAGVGTTSQTAVTATRPKTVFTAITGVNTTGSMNWSWNPGALSGSTVIVNPSVTTTYTVTATDPVTTCSSTNTVTVNVNPLPPAPAGNNGTDQCGTSLTDANVSSNNVTDPQVPPFFKWYFVPTGGTAQQSGTSTTFTTVISATTDFYVSEVSANGCEGPRVHISTIVSTADPITVNATHTTVCLGGSTDISASYTPDFNSFATYTLTATGGTASGLPGAVPLNPNGTGDGSDPYTVTPTATGTYTYTITANDPDKNCTAVNTVVVTVSALPVISSVSATPSTICAGASVNLVAIGAPQYANVPVTGYNADLVANGTGSVSSSTTSTFDNAVYTLAAADWNFNGSCTPLTNFMPVSGTVTANATAAPAPGLTYVLQPYNANNALRIPATGTTGGTGTGTLTLITPVQMSKLYLLYGVGNGPITSGINVTVNFTDATSQAFTGLTGKDWFDATTPAIENLGRVDRTITPACVTTTTGGPRLFDLVMTLNGANYAKLVQSVTIAVTNGTATLVVMGVGRQAPPANYQTSHYNWTWNPGNIADSVATVTPSVSTTYTVSVTDPATTCSATATTTVTVNPLPAAPSTNDPVTRCGPGSVTLTATGGPGILHWYNVASGGTSLQTGGTFTTNVTSNTSFWVAETSEFACEGPRTQVHVTLASPPTLAITAGGATTFCQGGSVTLNGATASSPSYVNFNWSATPSNGAGLSSATGASITVTPTVAGTYTITLTADDGQPNGCADIKTVVVTMNPNPVITTATANPATTCSGGAVTLNGTSINALPGTTFSGALSGTAATNTTIGTLFGIYYGNGRSQALYTAAELSAAGLTPGNITSLGVNVASIGNGTALIGYSLKVAATTATSLSSYLTPTWTTVYGPANYSPTVGVNTFTLGTPFVWDGTSNIVIEYCFSNQITGTTTTAVTNDYTTTAYNSFINYQLDGATSNICTNTSITNTSGSRPRLIFGGQVGTVVTGSLNWVWNPGALSGSTVTVHPTSTTSYTVTATNPSTGCFTVSSPINVTVTPVGSAASASSPAICTGSSVTLNANPTGGGPFTFSWNNGVGVVGTTDPLTVSPTSTTTYTVTVTDACNNSTTSSVTVTVNPLPTASIQETGPITLCSPATQTLHAVTNAASPSYQWTLNGTNIPSATASTYVINTVSSGTYRIIVTNTATNCVSVASAGVVVTINPQPSAVTITPPTATICNGSSQLLTASGGTTGGSANAQIGAGATTITGATTSLGSPYNHWYGGIKQQMIYTKAELNAAGITAGNINALSFELTALGSSTLTMPDFTINIAHTTQATATTTLITTGFTQVYSSASQGVTLGINNYVFSTPFNYNNTDNIVVSICWSEVNSGVTAAIPTIKVDAASFTATSYIYADNTSVAALFAASSNTSSGVGSTSQTNTTTTRPKIVFAYSSLQNPTWSWLPATGLSATNVAAVTASPSTTTTYTATATNSFGCTNSSTATVTVNPRPTAVISGSGAYCQGTNTTTNLTVNFTGTAPWNYTYTVDGGSPVSGTTSSNPLTITVTPSNAAGHVFTYAISALSDANCASIAADLTGTGTVTVNPLAANPTATVVQPTCALGTGTINVTSPLGAGNTYSLDGINFQPSPSFPGQAPGTYTVYVNNSFGCFSPATINVTVNPQPFVPGAPVVTGTVNVCPFIGVAGAAGQLTYTATATGFGTQTFNWVVPTTNVTIVSGQGTGTLVLSFQNGFATQANKQLRLTVTNQCGTSSMTIYYLAAQIPNTPAPIVGPTDACPLLGGPAVAYTITKAPGAKEYFWSVPAGASFTRPNGVGVNDTTILVSFTAGYATGPITVQSSNDCGVSGIRSLTVTRIAPSQPNIISGPTNACPYITPNAAATYTVPAVPGVTYTWSGTNGAVMSSPQGSNTMLVSYPIGYTGGTISVTATTGCGTSAARNLVITTLNPATPGVPDVIQTHFCGEPGGRKFTYTLSSTPANATSVVWTVPAGATFINLTPISIEVTYPDAAVSGVVTVQAVNPCANSVIRSVNVKLPACPVGFAGNNTGTNGTAETKGVIKTPKSTPAPALAEAMEVKIFPNPTVSDFKLEVLTSGTEEITVRVLDNLGRLYKNFKLMPNQIIALGAELKSGSYLVEVRQGKTVKTTKVIKF
ncbi:MAG: T9SS type A sorting domain-containing protein [Ferruginibacter sp.]